MTCNFDGVSGSDNYISRYGSKRIAKVVLVGAVPPLKLEVDANPEGTPLEVFDGIRKGATSRLGGPMIR